MKRKKSWLILLVVAIVTISYLLWYIKSDTKFTIYRIAGVKNGDIAQIVSANGTLNPVTLVNIGTQITGKVQKIYADFNDKVEVGQVLLELDNSLLTTKVAQSKAEVKKVQADLDLAIANINRGKSLYDKKFISAQEWDKLLQEKRVAKAELQLARAKLVTDETNLNYSIIRSPVSGVVVDRQVDVGQTVTASFQTPILFQIAKDLSNMQIDTSFAEADIGYIKPGQKVTFSVDAFPEREFAGVVKQIRLASEVQQNVVTYNVVVLVKNNDKVLLPGMTTYVSIKIAEHKNILLIPNAALRFKPKESKLLNSKESDSKIKTIYKLVDDELVPVSCKIGVTDNVYTEVYSKELKVGDIVVVGYNEERKGTSSFRIKVF